MTPNDILRRLRYALDLSDEEVVRLIATSGPTVTPDEVRGFMGRDTDPDTVVCPDGVLEAFLDGVILERRGPPPAGAKPRPKLDKLTNNEVLKKLRVALKLQEQDLLGMLAEAGQPLSKSELGALFRKPGHRSYRPCGDQILRKVLAGITRDLRGTNGDDA